MVKRTILGQTSSLGQIGNREGRVASDQTHAGRNFLRSLSIRYVLVLVVTLGLLLPATILSGISLYRTYQHERSERLVALLRQYSELLEPGLAIALWNLDRDSAQRILQSALSESSVVNVSLYDERGGLWVQVGREGGDPDNSRSQLDRRLNYAGREVGMLRVVMSDADVRGKLQQDLMGRLLVLGAQLVLSLALILYLLNRRVLRPLDRLGHAAVQLGQKNLDHPIVAERNDEIGRLALQMETARGHLLHFVAALREQNVRLENELRERQRVELALRESEDLFARLFDLAPDAMALTSLHEGRLILVNVAWMRTFGYQQSDIEARTVADLALWVDLDRRQEVVEALRRGDDLWSGEVWFRRADQQTVLFDAAVSATVLNGEQVSIWVLRDVTEKNRARQEIEALNARLEERVRERTQELVQANVELRDSIAQLNRARDEIVRSEKLAALGALVAGIAHELNTPIGNSVTVASTLVEMTHGLEKAITSGIRRTDLDRYVKDAIVASDLIQRNLGRASDLISGFKQVAVDQTSSQRRPFLLDAVLQEMVLILGPVLRSKGATIDLTVPADVMMDSYPGPLGQVINNLVNNAILHAFDARGGLITIEAAHAPGGRVVITFADNGSGIRPEILSRIFDPFFTTKLGQGGSGLGLHIVHNVVTNVLGGSIRVTSELGQGTRFIVELPSVAPASESASAW